MRAPIAFIVGLAVAYLVLRPAWSKMRDERDHYRQQYLACFTTRGSP